MCSLFLLTPIISPGQFICLLLYGDPKHLSQNDGINDTAADRLLTAARCARQKEDLGRSQKVMRKLRSYRLL